MMERDWIAKRVGSMEDESIICRDYNRRGAGAIRRSQDQYGRASLRRDLRPRIIDANDLTGKEAVGVLVLNVRDVPPEFVDACEGGEHEKQQRE